MKKSMATAQMKSTRIALLVLLALPAMSEVDRATRDRVCACFAAGIPWYHSRLHLHVFIGRQHAAEHHQFRTCGETTGQNGHIYFSSSACFHD